MGYGVIIGKTFVGHAVYSCQNEFMTYPILYKTLRILLK